MLLLYIPKSHVGVLSGHLQRSVTADVRVQLGHLSSHLDAIEHLRRSGGVGRGGIRRRRLPGSDGGGGDAHILKVGGAAGCRVFIHFTLVLNPKTCHTGRLC